MTNVRTGITIAWIEFARGTGLFGLGRLFGLRRNPVLGKDYISLTLLVAIVITLIAFSITAGRGVSENITQIMVGHVQKAGAPIWVFVNTSREAIDGNTLSVFRNGAGFDGSDGEQATAVASPESLIGKLNFYPVTELEMRSPYVQLPTSDAWNAEADGGDLAVDFRGWAVDADNPLWASNTNGPATDFSVVLSRSLFEKHFNYPKYRAFLAEQLTAAELSRLPANLKEISNLSHIYLALPFGNETKRLLSFDVIWADNLPGLQKVSMLVPYEIVARARAVWENPKLSLVFETDLDDYEESFQILDSIEFRGLDLASSKSFVDENEEPKNMKELTACLGKSVEELRNKETLTLAFRRAPHWPLVENCLKTSRLNGYPNLIYNFNNYRGWHADGRFVTASCSAVRPHVLVRDADSSCRGEEGAIRFTPFPYFRTGLVFVPPGIAIISAVEDVLSFSDRKGAVFLIPETYWDALLRMDFTQKIIRYVTSAIGALGLILLAMVLFLQISPLLSGRRKTYGLLLARGVPWRALYFGAFFQFLLITVFATLIATGLTLFLHAGLEHFFAASEAAETAKSRFGLPDPRFLPEGSVDDALISQIVNSIGGSLVLSSLGVGLSMLAFLIIVLWRIPIRASTVPVELLVGRPVADANSQEKRNEAV